MEWFDDKRIGIRGILVVKADANALNSFNITSDFK